MGILTAKMKKYVLSEDKAGYNKATQSTYDRRIVEYCQEALKDLKLLAERLSEEHQAEIFNEQYLGPLLKNIFILRIKRDMEKEELDQRRNRILQVCYDALSDIGVLTNAWALAPDIMKILQQAGPTDTIHIITGLKAIYLKGLSQQQK
jgi:hypothetical protein